MKKSKKRIRKRRKWSEGIHGVEEEGTGNLRRDGRLGTASNGWSADGSGEKSDESTRQEGGVEKEGKVL